MFSNPFKKNKKPAYDVTNLGIMDLNVGFVFDYDLKSWVVEEAYEYDWGGNHFSKEFKVNAGDDVAFLSVEDDGDLNISMTKSIKLRAIEEDVMEEITKNKKAPKTIHFKKETYYLESDSAGYFREAGSNEDSWEELISWEYFNESEDKIVCLTQWDEYNVEASAGAVVSSHQISDILPGSEE